MSPVEVLIAMAVALWACLATLYAIVIKDRNEQILNYNRKPLRITLQCKSMVAANDLTNALVENLVEGAVDNMDVSVQFGGYNDWYIKLESPKEKAPDFSEA